MVIYDSIYSLFLVIFIVIRIFLLLLPVLSIIAFMVMLFKKSRTWLRVASSLLNLVVTFSIAYLTLIILKGMYAYIFIVIGIFILMSMFPSITFVILLCLSFAIAPVFYRVVNTEVELTGYSALVVLILSMYIKPRLDLIKSIESRTRYFTETFYIVAYPYYSIFIYVYEKLELIVGKCEKRCIEEFKKTTIKKLDSEKRIRDECRNKCRKEYFGKYGIYEIPITKLITKLDKFIHNFFIYKLIFNERPNKYINIVSKPHNLRNKLVHPQEDPRSRKLKALLIILDFAPFWYNYLKYFLPRAFSMIDKELKRAT